METKMIKLDKKTDLALHIKGYLPTNVAIATSDKSFAPINLVYRFRGVGQDVRLVASVLLRRDEGNEVSFFFADVSSIRLTELTDLSLRKQLWALWRRHSNVDTNVSSNEE